MESIKNYKKKLIKRFELDQMDINSLQLQDTNKDNLEKKSYKTGDRKKSENPNSGCNFRMKDGEICGGETTGKAKCMCRRHNGNLHLDITQRGMYPLIDSEGKTMDKDNKNKVKATNKYFMEPIAFKEYKKTGKKDIEDMRRNPLIYILYHKNWYDNINKKNREERTELFNMYNSKDKSSLFTILRNIINIEYINNEKVNGKVFNKIEENNLLKDISDSHDKDFFLEKDYVDECPKNIKYLQRNIMTRTDFLKNAPDLNLNLWDNKLNGKARSFTSNNMGWYTGGKVKIEIDGKYIWGQIGINLTIIGSKEWN